MLKNKFNKIFTSKPSTLLGIGPMSKNITIAAIELSNLYNIDLMLIASRRQIDSKSFGGGYVNNWDTKNFSNFVNKLDKKKKIILCRDHGGPWQNDIEIKSELTLSQAMRSAKKSYQEDINSNFKIIHIDPSIDPHNKNITTQQILDRVFELYGFIMEYANIQNKSIDIEIGTEEQSGLTNSIEELEYSIKEVKKFCNKNKFPKPLFFVAQTGTKVLETENIGSFETGIRQVNEIPAEIQIPKLIEICKKHNIFLKEHNGDYMSLESLKWHTRLGINAVNIAPEFGVAESKAFIKILENNNLQSIKNKFVELSYNSGKWKKWMKENTKANDIDKAIIAGHYVFSSKEFIQIKYDLEKKLYNNDLDKILIKEIKKVIMKYLNSFNLVA